MEFCMVLKQKKNIWLGLFAFLLIDLEKAYDKVE